MIITLKGANFSASNIGALDSWFITRDFGLGVNYNGPTSVKKNAALNATITISSGYELNGSVSVTMGGSSVTSGITTSGNTITISIASVTGAVTIKVPTKSTSGGEEPDVPVTPDVPDGETIWYINSLQEMQQTNKDITQGTECTPQGSSGWAFREEFNNKLVGQVINTIELYANRAGVFTIGVYNRTSKDYTTTRSITVSEINIAKKYTFEDFTLTNDDLFVWNVPKDDPAVQAAGYYLLSGQDDMTGLTTSKWYFVYEDDSLSVQQFGEYELALSMNVGYTNN